jgi:4-amino-4-deoxy-L-arabinose transferase-like glycosyltransferase
LLTANAAQAEADRASTRAVLLIVALGLAARTALAGLAPITTDEAYYVDWARHLAPGYLDHPPLVAWLVAGPLGTFGRHVLAVRLPSLLLQAGTTLLAASLARAWAGAGAAVLAAALLQVAPVFSVGALLATPDAPLAFAWSGALWAVDRALRGDRRLFLLAGAFLGMAALSKLTGGLLAAGLLAALVATRDGRRALATPWPWLGAAAALLLASPMLLWNAARGWPSLAFQLRHGLSGRSFSWARLAQSVGAQAAYVSPVVLVLAAGAAWRALRAGVRQPAARLAAALTALPVAAFFSLSAARTPGALPHWPAPAWLSALLLLAAAGTRWARLALWSGGALVAALVLAVALPLPWASPLDEARGWEEALQAAHRLAPGARLATTHWMAVGHLGWYADEPLAYVSDRVAGPSFYAPPPPDARPLLVVAPEGLGPDRAKLEALLGPLAEEGELAATWRGRVVRRYRFYMAGADPRRASNAPAP